MKTAENIIVDKMVAVLAGLREEIKTGAARALREIDVLASQLKLVKDGANSNINVSHAKQVGQVSTTGVSTDQLLSRAEAAKYLGLQSQTLAGWATSKRYDLPYISIGRRAMYRVSDLEAFIAANRHVMQ